MDSSAFKINASQETRDFYLSARQVIRMSCPCDMYKRGAVRMRRGIWERWIGYAEVGREKFRLGFRRAVDSFVNIAHVP